MQWLRGAAQSAITAVKAAVSTDPLVEFKRLWTSVKTSHTELVHIASSEQLAGERRLLESSGIAASLSAMVELIRLESLETGSGDGAEDDDGAALSSLEGGGGGGASSKPRRRKGKAKSKLRKAVGRRASASSRAEGVEFAPCLEYMLIERVVEQLCTMCLADRPVGMMALVLQTIYDLLLAAPAGHTLLQQMSVSAPIANLITVCVTIVTDANENSGNGGRMQKRLVDLIVLVWRTVARGGEHNSEARLVAFWGREGGSAPPRLVLFGALCRYMHARGKIGTKSRAALVTALSLPNRKLARYAASHSRFAEGLARGIARALKARAAAEDELDAAEAAATGESTGADADGVAVAVAAAEAKIAAAEQRFAECVELCDRAVAAAAAAWSRCAIDDAAAGSRGASVVVAVPCSPIVDAVLAEVARRVFAEKLVTNLLHTEAKTTLSATWTLQWVVEILSAQSAADAAVDGAASATLGLFLRCILGDGAAPELEAGDAGAAAVADMEGASGAPGAGAELGARWGPRCREVMRTIAERKLRQTLIHRISAINVQSAIATLSLFGTLLSVQPGPLPSDASSSVLENLVRRNVAAGAHFADGDARRAQYIIEGRRSSAAHDDAPPRVEALRAVVEHLATLCGSTREAWLEKDASFTAYLLDAQQQQVYEQVGLSGHRRDLSAASAARVEEDAALLPAAAAVATATATATTASASSTPPQSPPSPPFFEGLFLRVLFDRLELMLDSSLSENLALTSVLSKVVISQSSIVLEFLFETGGIPHREGIRSLSTVLSAVLREARRRAARVPDFEAEVRRIREGWRERCSREDMEKESGGLGGFVVVDDMGGDGEFDDEFDSVTAGRKSFLEAYVLLEDWCKELGATLEAQCMVMAVNDEMIMSMSPRAR